MQEKRVHERTTVRLQGTLEVPGSSPVSVAVTDLSLGGVYVQTSACPRLGVAVTVAFDLEGRSLRLPGTVRWTKPDGLGIQFGLLGARDTHTLSEFLKKHRV